ncbi:pentatricopeptide repeat-containing protein At5g13270, chloroplastic [Ricinus communis]|uniref:pentatricopeptide repeat-containing protein At5g13270, chloroplastic n=1 Tax=Ricinus communis TaxID=3988 RepID=UPI0007725145|nr:pentatricopeptide repeat-containing protein At5g13270, chloroplastic [Ricinus communis]|eukprot:XP_015570525.1 pentatricopeptide repeat-containing protein At5g13270, chloroplastic [Ricinus communis]
MDVQYSFAVKLSNPSLVKAHDKVPIIKSANFAQLPSWVSLKGTPPLHQAQQNRKGQVENVHLVSLSKQGKLKEAREFLKQMVDAGISVSPDSYRNLFEICGNSKSLSDGKIIHELLRRTVEKPSVFLENTVLKMYCVCESLEDAYKVFDKMIERNLISWGTIISAYAEHGLLDKALSLFISMISLGINPNSSIYIDLLRSLLNPSLLGIGKQIHSHSIRSGLGAGVSINTAISNMYVRCGWLDGAELFINNMAEKNAVAWTGLMVGYTQAGKQKNALDLFAKMVCEDVELDEYVFSISLKACAGLKELSFGRQIHGHIVKLGLESEVSVGTPLVDFYIKCASFELASKVFEGISEPNDVSWSAMITGYCQIGEFEEALKIFESLRSNIENLNSFTYTSIFQACSALADFSTGTQVHADAIKRSLIASQHGESAMITMYSRCGRLDYANLAFETIDGPDAVAWTAIVAGYAYQGNATEALKHFWRMQGSGARPNAITFIAVLTACSHSGLVAEGKQYLDLMSSKYGMAPTIDHYDCVIDIYSRAGYLQEALEVIRRMPFDPDAMSWKCLLGGCWTHRNLELGKIAAENLLQLDPEDTAGYILMFNLYASFGKWKEAANVRKSMAERNLRKELSCSWITVKGKVHRFIVGDKHHPQTEQIYKKLGEFKDIIKAENGLLTEEDVSSSLPERKEQLLEHSERLAIAFGLISVPSNAPIVVFKNLRACRDCHDFAKQVSGVTGRVIVVRDSFRFHHFKLGECSCNDYW